MYKFKIFVNCINIVYHIRKSMPICIYYKGYQFICLREAATHFGNATLCKLL